MKHREHSSVSFFENRLGRLATARPGWWQWLGNQETRYYAKALAGRQIDRPVYITGLARSGTTLILEFLAAHEQTATHRYRDYPFLDIPVWWNRFLDRAGAKDGKPGERFHGDRIIITAQSPEAMEEILWMAFFPDCHAPSADHVFKADTVHPAFDLFYREHIRKILFLRSGTRYVAKANYHVTRLEYLQRLFPDARFVVPVRSPVSHIASLCRQHHHFCRQEQRDARILSYMRRTGHFEFGLDRRPVNTGNPELARRILRLWDEGDDVRGLALAWRSVYQFVTDRLENNKSLRSAVLLVHYEDLCRSPEKTLRQIYDHCELPVSDRIVNDQARQVSPSACYACPFSDENRAVIEMETHDVYQRVINHLP